MDYLILKKILNQSKGNYIDFSGKKIVVTGSYSVSRCKQRYLPDNIYESLLELKRKDREMLEMDLGKDQIKDNQKYMFSNVSNISKINECVS